MTRAPAGVRATIARDPLLWFLVAAVALFMLNDVGEPPAVADAAVRVSARDLEELVEGATRKLNRVPTDEETQALFQSHVERKILLQEARRLGLYEDAQVEAMVLDKLRFALGDAGDSNLDPAALRACYDARPDSYRLGEAFAYEAVLFTEPGAIPAGLPAAMDEKADPEEVLSNSPHRRAAGRNATRPDLIARFGAGVEAVLDQVTPTPWYGPLAADSHVAFIRLLERRAPRLLPFEEVRDVVAVDCIRERQSRAFSRALADLVARASVRYEVDVIAVRDGRFVKPESK